MEGLEDQQLQFTIDNIEQTLHQFYHDAQSQAQANRFLMLAQISPEAWNFAWQLLHPSKPHEAQFFGASTLQSKISKHWHQVPHDQYGVLRDKLLQALFGYTTGPKVILTRLCIAMSIFVIQTITDFWPTAVTDLMSALQPQNVPDATHQQVAHTLLELLTVLSEEFHTAHLSQSRKSIVRHALQLSFQAVVNLIENVLSKNITMVEISEMALKCYSSWGQLGSSVWEYESLLHLSFDAVYKDDLCQTALETLSNLATHPSGHKYPSLILMMVEHLAKFDSLLLKATQEDDMDKCCSIYALILAVAENHSKLLLEAIIEKPEKKDVIMKIIGFILQCSGTPGQYPVDEICSEQAFGFWYTLQDGIMSLEDQRFKPLLLIFYPVFHSLMDTYLVKLRYPSDEVFQSWKADEQESFRCYRQDIGDSIMFCYNILRQAALANLAAHLTIATTTATNDASQWQYLEACLFAFKEVAESVDCNEQCYIPQFMAHLPNIPLQHLRVISSSMEVVGAYAEWIIKHPDVMCYVIPLLLMGLQNSEVAPSASFALKDITRDCHSSVLPFAEQILVASQDALKENILKSRERVRLMSTVGHVLSIMPFPYIMSYLDSLLTPLIDHLQHLASQLNECNPSNKAAIVLDLHMLSMLFATLDTKWERGKESDDEREHHHHESLKRQQNNSSTIPQPVLLILEKVMPIFSLLGSNWASHEQVTEALCDALKRAVSTLFDECRVLIPDMIHLLLHLYKTCPHSTVLDMVKQMLLLFVDDENQRVQLTDFFAEICNHTLELTLKDFRPNTSIIEIFLQLLSQVIKKAFVFFKNDILNLPIIFQCGVAALNLPEKPTVKSASSFITEFITHSREVPNMLNVVNNHGEMLVVQVLKTIGGGESPRSVVEYMPDILMALNKKYFDNLCRWLSSFSTQEGFPSSRVSQQQKEEFVRLVLKERANKRKLKEIVSEFSLLCRGLIGTEYAAQSGRSILLS